MPKSKRPKKRFNRKATEARIPVGATGYRGNQAMIAKVMGAGAQAPKGKR